MPDVSVQGQIVRIMQHIQKVITCLLFSHILKEDIIKGPFFRCLFV